MSLEQFLDRMVAPGNYLAVAFKARQGIAHQFFPRNNIADAAKLIHWASDTINTDVWYALASYNTATPETNKAGRQVYRGQRTQANAQALKCFWFDADIKRAGDGKDPGKVFKDRAELVRWVKDFSAATGIPLPNVWVNSGYGVHLYWTLTTALPRDQWQPHAEALKAALIAHGAKGDTSVVADAARILRPIGTFNHKDPANPTPCHSILDQPNYANADLLAALPTTGSRGLTGAPSKVAQRATTSVAANAMAGISAQPRDFQQIANSCAQVGTSLTEHGEHDGRQLWRAMLTLAFFCEDACDWSHEVGSLHPTYDQAKTDAEVGRIVAEHARKSFGAPLCTSLDAERPGVCATCPHLGNVTTPYQLGLQAAAPVFNPNTLPKRYRRNNGWIEAHKKNKKGDYVWVGIVQCDIYDPIVELVGGRTRLTFTFHRLVGARVTIYHDELFNTQVAHGLLSLCGVYLSAYNTHDFLELLMAWIEQLTKMQPLHKPLPSFGWATANGNFSGLGVGGVFYDLKGQELEAPGADRALVGHYTPEGSLATWQQAAKFVMSNVPELHTIVAVSLGAPLMTLTGETGGCMAFAGPSGVGKSSAFIAGAAVWGDPLKTMLSLDDTSNAQAHALGQTRVMPRFWDEAKIVTKERQAELVTMLHKLTQGRDKARMTSDIKMREVGEWNTIFPLATNNSVADLIAAQDGQRSATLLRVLEITVPARRMAPVAGAPRIVASLRMNYGHAGRRYAHYLAQNIAGVQAQIAKVTQMIMGQTLAPDTDERFYTAMAACTITGAMIANRMRLLDFDIPGIIRVLLRAIEQARAIRHNLEPVDEAENLVNILERFMADHMEAKVITSRWKTAGPGPIAGRVLIPNGKPTLPTPAYHLAVADRGLKIDCNHWRTWTTRNGFTTSQTIQKMKALWNAQAGPSVRGPLGAGTLYYSHNSYYILIPLDQNLDLQYLLDIYEDYDITTGSGKKVVPLRQGMSKGTIQNTPPP